MFRGRDCHKPFKENVVNKRQIYIDIDDVISDTTVTFPALLEEHFGKTVSFDAITSFDLGISFDLDENELSRFMDIAHSPDVIAAYRPRTGAIESLHSFISLGYDIVIVTGRPPYARELTQEWLIKHQIPFQHLLFVDKYSRIFPDDSPSIAISLETLAQMDFCFAVEDSGYMAGFLSQHLKIPVALLDRPWNRTSQYLDHPSADLVSRCMGWNEVMDTFFSYASNHIKKPKSSNSHMA